MLCKHAHRMHQGVNKSAFMLPHLSRQNLQGKKIGTHCVSLNAF